TAAAKLRVAAWHRPARGLRRNRIDDNAVGDSVIRDPGLRRESYSVALLIAKHLPVARVLQADSALFEALETAAGHHVACRCSLHRALAGRHSRRSVGIVDLAGLGHLRDLLRGVRP